MANAYSIPQNMGTYVDPIDNELIGSVLASKEKKYDYNVAKVDSLIQQYTNLPLARDEDKQYLKDRIDSVLKVVNGVSKLDMSNNNITRQIEQGIGTAIDDHVLEQMANTKKIMTFEQEVAKKREKGDGTYDDRNYTIAKKRAGIDEYLAGEDSKGNKVDKIGSLRYDDYYDLDKNLTEPLEKWAKELGYTKTVSESGVDLFIRKETKEELTPERIEQYYNTKLQSDPKLQTQMRINSEYEYGGKDDSTFKQEYRGELLRKKTELEAGLAKVKTAYKNEPAGSEMSKSVDVVTAQFQNEINLYDDNIKNVDSGKFDRSSVQTQMYSNRLLNNYKNTYAKSVTVGIDYDDSPMKLQEFEWKKEEAIRKQKEDKNKEAGLNADGTGLGTTYTPKSEEKTEAEKPDLYTVAGKNFSQDYRKFDAYLMATDEDYAKGDAKTRKTIRDQYTINISKESLTAKGMPKEGKDLAEAYIQSSQTYTKVSREVNKTIDNDIIAMYNGMVTNVDKINLNNFKDSMPETAKAMANKKSYKDLTKAERYTIKLELSDNLKNTVAKGNSIKHLDSYNKSLQKDSGIKFKQADISGFWDNAGSEIGGKIGLLGVGARKWIARGVDFFNSEAAKEMWDSAEKDEDKYFNQVSKATAGERRNLSSIYGNIFINDEDLGSIGSDEIAIKKGEDIRSRWSGTAKSIEDRIGLRLKDIDRPRDTMKGISYNPNVKAEEGITQSLQSILLSEGVTPTKETAYKVEFNPDGVTAKIIVNSQNLDVNDKGKQVKIVGENVETTVEVSRLPKSIINNVSAKKADWTYDFNNPAQFSKVYTFDVLPTEKDKDEYLDNFAINNPNTLSPERLHEMKVSNDSPIKTEQEYSDIISKLQRTYNLTEENASVMKNNIVKAKYEIKYNKTVGVGFYGIIDNGDGTPVKFDMRGENFNPTKASMNSMLYVNNVILNKLNDYALKNAKK